VIGRRSDAVRAVTAGNKVSGGADRVPTGAMGEVEYAIAQVAKPTPRAARGRG
jgi:hypothetical protein